MAFNKVDDFHAALNTFALVRENDDRNRTIHRDHYDELLACNLYNSYFLNVFISSFFPELLSGSHQQLGFSLLEAVKQQKQPCNGLVSYPGGRSRNTPSRLQFMLQKLEWAIWQTEI